MSQAQPLPAPVAGPLAGDYYGQHDYCLYRVSYQAGEYHLARCTTPAETPALDVFSAPYSITTPQLERLLAFGCLLPAIR
jgi:hypothetical protein